jgi:hypothetical protein
MSSETNKCQEQPDNIKKKKKKSHSVQKSRPFTMCNVGMCKIFQAEQLCIVCRWKNDGHTLSLSIMLVLKIVRKQTPILIGSNQNLVSYRIFI